MAAIFQLKGENLVKVIVVGGGPAGMIAAIKAKEQAEVTLLEKNNRLGRKLAITGKGRCNITSSVPIEEFMNFIPGNGKFLYSSFSNFNNLDILNLLGIKVKEERGHRIFPQSDKAEDVVDALKRKLDGVKIIYDVTCENIIADNNKVIGVETSKGKMYADKIIIATGGKSYPVTGSTGDGYKMVEKVGHTIIEPKPSLVGLVVSSEDLQICRDLQGLNLKNVAIRVINNGKEIYDDFGEMLFTHFGISGPIILSASSHLAHTQLKNTKIIIDTKPALSEEKLDERILRDFSENKNKDFRNSLDELLPQKMIPIIVQKMGINKKVNEITKEERRKLVNLLKGFEIGVVDFRPIEEAIVTVGGISTKEINPKTMESKLIKDLYFAGEIIDVDAYTGGFNLQIAYSTGYTAGMLL